MAYRLTFGTTDSEFIFFNWCLDENNSANVQCAMSLVQNSSCYKKCRCAMQNYIQYLLENDYCTAHFFTLLMCTCISIISNCHGTTNKDVPKNVKLLWKGYILVVISLCQIGDFTTRMYSFLKSLASLGRYIMVGTTSSDGGAKILK